MSRQLIGEMLLEKKYMEEAFDRVTFCNNRSVFTTDAYTIEGFINFSGGCGVNSAPYT